MRTIEPSVTNAILDAIPSGATAHGLEFRVKDWRSLKRKADGIVEKDPYAFDDVESQAQIARMALSEIDDVLRYSVLSEQHDEIPAHASLFLKQTRAGKMTVVSILNSYHQLSRYKGVHAILDLEERFSFDMECEVQFHSPESISAYSDTHESYEALRISSDLAARQELHDSIAARYAEVDDIALTGHGYPVQVTNRVLRRPT